LFLFFSGVHFDTSSASLVNEITTAIKVYAYGVEDFTNDPANAGRSLNTQLSCEGIGAARWNTGDRFFRVLRNVSVEADAGKPNLEFTQDGVLRAAELKIMNLRPGVSKQLVWEEVCYTISEVERKILFTNSIFEFVYKLDFEQPE
jgi:ionotropic glutamate receptor NMDA 2B